MIANFMLESLPQVASQAVAHYWLTRQQQQQRQQQTGRADQGSRSAVTGGAHMDGFIQLFTRIITATGLDERYIHHRVALELPGYFRPAKE